MLRLSYEEYQQYGGTLEEAPFTVAEYKSAVWLERHTFGNIKKVDNAFGIYYRGSFEPFDTDELEMLKRALVILTDTHDTLSQLETASTANGGIITGRSSGGESIHYATSAYMAAIGQVQSREDLLRQKLYEVISPESFRFNPFYAGVR